MTDHASEIDAALGSQDPIPRDKVLRWIDSARDLSTIAKLYRLTGEDYYRIQPDLGKEAACKAIQQYFLECIRQSVPEEVSKSGEILGRWEAAGEFHLWLRQILEKGDCSDVITSVAQAITKLFLNSGQDVRDAIEAGFLEHALESEGLRPYFEHWSRDDRLREAWETALEWGRAHPDFTWGMVQSIRKIQNEK